MHPWSRFHSAARGVPLTSEEDGSLLHVPGGSVVKNPPVMQGPRVQFLGLENPLEEGMTTHSSILAWEIP